MPLKLIRTLLSTKPKAGSPVIALWGVAVLSMFFAIDQQDVFGLSRFLSANSEQVFGGHEYWRLFTATLIHADLGHFISNSGFFLVFAFLLNGYFGIWVFPVLSFLAGAVINGLTLGIYPRIYPGDVTLLGASGVVYFMVSFWLALYFWIERGVPPVRRGVNALAFALVLFFPESFDQRVSYLAHAIGFVLGALAGTVFFLLKREEIRRFEVWKLPESESELEAGLSLDLEADGSRHDQAV